MGKDDGTVVVEKEHDIQAACGAEFRKFCLNVPAGQGQALKCFRRHLKHENFGAECREEVEYVYKMQLQRQSSWRSWSPFGRIAVFGSRWAGDAFLAALLCVMCCAVCGGPN